MRYNQVQPNSTNSEQECIIFLKREKTKNKILACQTGCTTLHLFLDFLVTMICIFLCSSQNYRFVDVDKADYGDDPAGNSCRFIIGRLRKFTKYEIIIRAINSHGEGPLSRPSVGQTQEDGKILILIFQPFLCFGVILSITEGTCLNGTKW